MNVSRGSGRAVDLRVRVVCSLWNVFPFDTAGLCSFVLFFLSMGLFPLLTRGFGYGVYNSSSSSLFMISFVLLVRVSSLLRLQVLARDFVVIFLFSQPNGK